MSAALYYPYIHVRDVNWLKGTLLLFPQVQRMLPRGFQPDDEPELRGFTEYLNGHEPLLAGANIFSPRAQQAQQLLARELRADGANPDFQMKFGRNAVSVKQDGGDLGFQIHQMKLDPELKEALRVTGLAWNPGSREPYDYGEDYVELHPRVGQAIMSTLAIACALADGLDIVGDRRSEGLHRCLIEKNAEAVYQTWLRPKTALAAPLPATGEELAEFLIGFTCDVSKLGPAEFRSLGEDREPLRNLLAALRERAREVKMDPGLRREQRFRDEVSDILKAWRSDRANMSKFWAKFFGKGLLDPVAKLCEKLFPWFMAGTVGAGTTAATAAGLSLASLGAALSGSGAGIVVGLIAHAGKSYVEMRDEAAKSRHRYLTILENAGVVFRSDIGASNARAAQG